MRGRGPVAALVALLLALAAVSAGGAPASATPRDPCARVVLRAAEAIPGSRLASCLEERMTRSRPATVRTVLAAGGAHAVRSGSTSAFVTAIRSVSRWRVTGRDPEVLSGVFHFAAWRLEPAATGRSGDIVLELSSDVLPVSYVSTLTAGRLRLVYLRTWSGWSHPITLTCAACASTTAPPQHG